MDVETGQTPLPIVHEKLVVEKGEAGATVTAEVAKFTLVIVLVPANVLHVPVPTAGTLPARRVVVPQSDIVTPALEIVGKLSRVIRTVSESVEQPADEFLHTKV